MAKKNHKSSAAAQEAILDAAEEIVFEVGPAGMRISAVAKRAGMAHPNIIHHFGSRQGLLNALVKRVEERATQRITEAISAAMAAPKDDQLKAMTKVLESVYHAREGKVAVWLHLSGAESSLAENMQQIVEAAHKLRQTMDSNASLEETNRLVLLVSLALIGEVISGAHMKDALGIKEKSGSKVDFKAWLAAVLLDLTRPEQAINIKTD